jgi:hypothetical protein
MPQLKLTADILSAALIGFEVQKVALEGKIAAVRLMLDVGRSEPASSSEIRKPRKKRSAAVRRKMALAQKARWAKIKQAAAPQAASPATKKTKRTMSAAGRKRIAAAQKKRWAAIKKQAAKKSG